MSIILTNWLLNFSLLRSLSSVFQYIILTILGILAILISIVVSVFYFNNENHDILIGDFMLTFVIGDFILPFVIGCFYLTVANLFIIKFLRNKTKYVKLLKKRKFSKYELSSLLMLITPNERSLKFNYKILNKLLEFKNNDVERQVIINLIESYESYFNGVTHKLNSFFKMKSYSELKFYYRFKISTQFIIYDYLISLKRNSMQEQDEIIWRYL